MPKRSDPSPKSDSELQAYSKRLQCLLDIWELLCCTESEMESVFRGMAELLPKGMQHSEHGAARIVFDHRVFEPADFKTTPWFCAADIIIEQETRGSVAVYYIREMPPAEQGPFLLEEVHFIETVAQRLGHFLHQRALAETVPAPRWVEPARTEADNWRALLQVYSGTNLALLLQLSNKMMIYLGLKGIAQADAVMQKRGLRSSTPAADDSPEDAADSRTRRDDILAFSDEIFRIAENHLSADEISRCLRQWVSENRNSTFVRTIANPDSTLRETIDAIRFFDRCEQQGAELSPTTLGGVQVHLIRRFLSEQLDFMKIAKAYLTKDDFCELIQRMIFLPGSHGKLGGKGARFFLTTRILRKESADSEDLQKIKMPKTWYLATGSLFPFMCNNDMEHVINQKYKSLDQIRKEYPLVVQFFRAAQFPPEVVRGLDMALDDFGDVPLAVRVSSMLEDHLGAEFSSVYPTRFVGNIGRKKDRLQALLYAVAESYASVLAPEPMAYRAERGLIDFEEDVGILIQEVVGMHVDKYYLPAFAGAARDSNGVKHPAYTGGGTMRIVFGLDARCADCPENHCGCMFALKNLQRLTASEENLTKSPGAVEAINRHSSEVEAIDFREFMKSYGRKIVGMENILSAVENDGLCEFRPVGFDYNQGRMAVTFDGLLHNTPLVQRVTAVLELLHQAYSSPVEVEFASDGCDLYLLECQPLVRPAIAAKNNP
ncbi:MAG: PEP/pyruvate-binding domain-containing protein [Calditrichota bacterium]